MKAPKIFKVLDAIALACYIALAVVSLWEVFNTIGELQMVYILSFLGWTCATVWIVAYMNKN